MNPNMAYSTDVTLAFMSLFFIAYIIYGRINNRSLIGGYKQGVPGYEVFRKIITNKYLAISSVLAVLFILNAVLDARRVLQSPYSDSVLVIAPVGIILLFSVIVLISSGLFRKK